MASLSNVIPSFYDAFIYALDVEQAQLIDTIVVADYVNIIQTGGYLSVTEKDIKGNIGFIQPGILLDPVVLFCGLKAILKYLLKQTEVIV